MFTLSIAAAALALSGEPAATSPCQGPAAQPGAVVTGVVLHVQDGERLCLANGPTPDRWTPISLSAGDLQPVSGGSRAWNKAALMSVAFGKKLTCEVKAASAGRAIATCAADGVPLESLLSAPEAEKAAAEWYQPEPRSGVTQIASR